MELSTGLGAGCGFGSPRRSCGSLHLQPSSSQPRNWHGVCAVLAQRPSRFHPASRVSRSAIHGNGNLRRVTYPRGRYSDPIALRCQVHTRRGVWLRLLWVRLRRSLPSAVYWHGWPQDLRGRLRAGSRHVPRHDNLTSRSLCPPSACDGISSLLLLGQPLCHAVPVPSENSGPTEKRLWPKLVVAASSDCRVQGDKRSVRRTG